MISKFNEEEAEYWNRQIQRYQRRQRLKARWALIRHLSPPVLFLAAAAIFLITCGHNPQPAASPALKIDSAILREHDSAVKREGGE